MKSGLISSSFFFLFFFFLYISYNRSLSALRQSKSMCIVHVIQHNRNEITNYFILSYDPFVNIVLWNCNRVPIHRFYSLAFFFFLSFVSWTKYTNIIKCNFSWSFWSFHMKWNRKENILLFFLWLYPTFESTDCHMNPYECILWWLVRAGMRFVHYVVVLNAYKINKPHNVVFGYRK